MEREPNMASTQTHDHQDRENGQESHPWRISRAKAVARPSNAVCGAKKGGGGVTMSVAASHKIGG